MAPHLSNLVYHLENPIRQPWQDICTVLERDLSLQRKNRVPFAIWLQKFTQTEHVSQDLTDFFHNNFLRMSGGGLKLGTEEACKASHSLRSSGDVGHGTIQKYVEFWRGTGFLT